MTCIVGLTDGNKVYIGGDSAGVSGYSVSVRGDAKVFFNGEMLFGFTSSFRMGQLLRYSLEIPKCETWDVEKYMCTDFVDALRTCFKKGGFAGTAHDGSEFAGSFLVGFKGRLWRIDPDYQVGWNTSGYDALGCGEDFALGALGALGYIEGLEITPEEKVSVALQAANDFSGGVTPPFNILSI